MPNTGQKSIGHSFTEAENIASFDDTETIKLVYEVLAGSKGTAKEKEDLPEQF